RLLKSNHNSEGNIFMKALKKLIHKTYAPLLDKALKSPKTTLVIALVLFIGSIGLFQQIGFKLFPDSEKPMFLINVKPSMQSNLYETNRIAKMVEDSLIQNPHIKFITTNVGKGNPRV